MIYYADHIYYTDTYKGAVLDTASFDLYARKATQIIKLHAFDKVKEDNIPDDVSMCCCELAEQLYSQSQAKTNNGVSSEKVGDYSVSYTSTADTETANRGKQLEIINTWLAHTGLLYRGCY